MSALQDLMAAEQRASQIISAARAERTEKMKQAQQEAQQVIDEYRREKEAALTASATSSGGDADLASLEQENDTMMSTMDSDYSANKPKTIDFLVNLVSSVDIIFPEDEVRE